MFNHKVDPNNDIKGYPSPLERHTMLLSEMNTSKSSLKQQVNDMMRIIIRIYNLSIAFHSTSAAWGIGVLQYNM